MPSRRASVRGLPDPPPAPTAPEAVETVVAEATDAPKWATEPVERPRLRDARRYVDDARLPRTMRLSTALYEDLGRLVRELEDQGYRTDRTELVHALLHYELPVDAEGARKLVSRWRQLIAR